VADGPRKGRRVAFGWPGWLVLLLCLSFLLPAGAEAQNRRRRKKRKKQKPVATVKEKKTKKGKVQNFDFTGLNLGASMRTPQLLYFLDRASEELKRASLQRRSFVPEMVRSISEEGL
jgi:hypothetical protein